MTITKNNTPPIGGALVSVPPQKAIQHQATNGCILQPFVAFFWLYKQRYGQKNGYQDENEYEPE